MTSPGAESVAETLEKTLLARMAAGKVTAPPMPLAATRALQILKQPNASIRDVCAAIEKDAALTAQVIRVGAAGSRGGVPRTIEQALVRVGLARVKDIVLAAASRGLFQSRDPALQALCSLLWQHSLGVAVVARDLAAMTGADADQAYVTGLLHDVGKPVAAAYLLEVERSLGARNARFLNDATFAAIVGRVHASIGVAIADNWSLPPEVKQIIAGEADAASGEPIVRCVLVANALVARSGLDGVPYDPALDDVLLVGSMMLGLDTETLERLVADLRNRPELRGV